MIHPSLDATVVQSRAIVHDSQAARPYHQILRYYRLMHCWTHAQLADRLYQLSATTGRVACIENETIGRWERGICQPSLFYQNLLCQLYGVSPADLGLCAFPAYRPLQALRHMRGW